MPPKTQTEHGEILLEWKTPAFPKYNRGVVWHIIAGAIGVAFLISAIASANYVFAIVIFMFAIIIAITSLRNPDLLTVRITETGVNYGSRSYPYRDIDRFAIVYEPPMVKNLYLDFKTGLRPRLTIDLGNRDPLAVRELLLAHVREDLERTDEPLSEFMGRILKI